MPMRPSGFGVSTGHRGISEVSCLKRVQRISERSTMTPSITRRSFLLSSLSTAGAVTLASSAPSSEARPLALGFDNFSVRACRWDAARILEYAATQPVDSVFFSDLEVFTSHEEPDLAKLKRRADELGLSLHVGTGSVCPTSAIFDPRYGSAEDRLALTIRVARQLGSPVARCYLGNAQDRKGDGGIERHIEAMIETLRKCRPLAVDAGIKIGVENHAGDMQARELAGLIEAAGRDFVGATLDSGNATWTLEDPYLNLEILGPYAVTTGIRDSMIWETPEGAAVQWTAMGEGLTDWSRYFARYRELCPNVPVQLEIISGFNRDFPWRKSEFWQGYEGVPAAVFAGFLELAKSGTPRAPKQFPEGDARREAEAAYQLAELEKSLRFCAETLGLGRRSV